jgi:hypothetical protein
MLKSQLSGNNRHCERVIGASKHILEPVTGGRRLAPGIERCAILIEIAGDETPRVLPPAGV